MKKIILLLLFINSIAFAEITNILITRFAPIHPTRNIAELCGIVDFTEEELVRVRAMVDNRRAAYVTFTDTVGNFCMVVTTYYGNVRVSADAPFDNSNNDVVVIMKYE